MTTRGGVTLIAGGRRRATLLDIRFTHKDTGSYYYRVPPPVLSSNPLMSSLSRLLPAVCPRAALFTLLLWGCSFSLSCDLSFSMEHPFCKHAMQERVLSSPFHAHHARACQWDADDELYHVSLQNFYTQPSVVEADMHHGSIRLCRKVFLVKGLAYTRTRVGLDDEYQLFCRVLQIRLSIVMHLVRWIHPSCNMTTSITH